MANEQNTGKQPYIPLYIGDWEKDMNMISLEAEGGWLKIIFKMFQNGKSGVYKISAKSLQNLWKKSSDEVKHIVEELKEAHVCVVEYDTTHYTFQNRRMIRQYKISKERSKSGKKGGKAKAKNMANSGKPL